MEKQGHGRGFSPRYVNPQGVSPSGFISLILNHRQFCPAGNLWPGLGTFLIVMTRDVGLVIAI